MGDHQLPTGSSDPPRIEYGPNPRDMVQIKEGTPYTVPVGKLFVLTALGASENPVGASVSTSIRVNGQPEFHVVATNIAAGVAALTTMVSVPQGFTVAAGATIDVDDPQSSTTYGRAWGYLANQ